MQAMQLKRTAINLNLKDENEQARETRRRKE